MMSALRLVRIIGFALAFLIAFTVSQRATLTRSGETVPGIVWAIAALSTFFMLGAYFNERSQGPEANPRKDLMWGLASGGFLIVVLRLAGRV